MSLLEDSKERYDVPVGFEPRTPSGRCFAFSKGKYVQRHAKRQSPETQLTSSIWSIYRATASFTPAVFQKLGIESLGKSYVASWAT
jgi:hypothetical protein